MPAREYSEIYPLPRKFGFWFAFRSRAHFPTSKNKIDAHYPELRNNSHDVLPTFVERLSRDREIFVNAPADARVRSYGNLFGPGRYAHYAHQWYANFPREQVFICKFEDMVTQWEAFRTELFGFLALPARNLALL